MSHIVTVDVEVRDLAAVQAACRRLGLDQPQHGRHSLFAGQPVTGHAISLPEWRYPVVCDVDAGRLHYDNYHGRWGGQKHLERFVQAYAVEKAKLEARKQGKSCTEQTLPDGSIKLTVRV